MNNTRELEIYISDIDKERFGYDTVKANIKQHKDIGNMLTFCKKNNTELLISRCSIFDINIVQELEKHGFLLMDTLVYYTFDFTKKIFQPVGYDKIKIENMKPEEEKETLDVVSKTFHNYIGHYHADLKLDNTKCDEVYVDWIRRKCHCKNDKEEFTIVIKDSKIVGFALGKINNSKVSELSLVGIHPKYQKMGIYNILLNWGMNWGLKKGAKIFQISTQINNIAVQKVWSRNGLEMNKGYYTFHKWFI